MQTEGETHKRILMQVENLTPRRAERKQTPKTHSDCMTCLASVINFSVTVFVSLLGGHVPEIRFRKSNIAVQYIYIYVYIHSVRQNFVITTNFS